MAIYTISDLHLSFNTDKPMNIFGSGWTDYENKIRQNWESSVKEDDYVILPGDHSWALRTDEALQDLRFIHNLPGRKILLKGNHDLWWATSKKMEEFKEKHELTSLYFFYNDYLEIPSGDKIHTIAGTRGWLCPGDNEYKVSTDEKIYIRESLRLSLSLEKAHNSLNKIPESKRGNLYVFMHYPPYNIHKDTLFTQEIEKYNVSTCYYGHIHGFSKKEIKEAPRTNIQLYENGAMYSLVSCDYTDFQLVKVSD